MKVWECVVGTVLGLGIDTGLYYASRQADHDYHVFHAERICRHAFFDGADVQPGGSSCYIDHPPVRFGVSGEVAWHTVVSLRMAKDFELEAWGLQQLKRSQIDDASQTPADDEPAGILREASPGAADGGREIRGEPDGVAPEDVQSDDVQPTVLERDEIAPSVPCV